MTSLVTKSCLEPRLPVEDTSQRQSLSQFCLQTPDVFKEKVEVGEGTFGKVYKAKINNTLYALKKIKMESQKNGFPITSVREIMVLRKLKQHPNIVQLEEIVRSTGKSIYLVFEYVQHDLQKLIEKETVVFTKMQLKYILKQMLEGLEYMHKRRIIHRDIKGGNILINSQGVVKLADFGLARDMIHPQRLQKQSEQQYTTHVVTRWFRAPEVALLDPCYDEKIDVWSIGCTFAELICRKTLFPSKSDLDHFPTILRQLQANDDLPQEQNWPGFQLLFKKVFPTGMPKRLPDKSSGSIKNFFDSQVKNAQNILADDETIKIIEWMLQLCPKNRPTCTQLLADPFFADLTPNFKLDIESIVQLKFENTVNVDVLGKRAATYVVDLELEPGKRQKLIP